MSSVLNSVQCAVCSVQCAVCSVQYLVAAIIGILQDMAGPVSKLGTDLDTNVIVQGKVRRSGGQYATFTMGIL